MDRPSRETDSSWSVPTTPSLRRVAEVRRDDAPSLDPRDARASAPRAKTAGTRETTVVAPIEQIKAEHDRAMARSEFEALTPPPVALPSSMRISVAKTTPATTTERAGLGAAAKGAVAFRFSRFSRIREDWKNGSPIVKSVLLVLPLVLVVAILAPKGSLSRSEAAASLREGPLDVPAALSDAPTATKGAATKNVDWSALPAVRATPAPAPLRARADLVARASAPPVDRVLEKKAIDAALAGDAPKALALYEELARTHPERPEYGATVRILAKDARGRSVR